MKIEKKAFLKATEVCIYCPHAPLGATNLAKEIAK